MTEQHEQEKTAHPTRWLWVFIGALLMGGIALGAMFLMKETDILFHIKDPELQFWAFEFGTGLGFLIGGFIVAILSPGETIREPMIAAVLAFVGQTAFLWFNDWIIISPKAFIGMAVIDGALAYGGAWAGEKLTGAIA